MEIYVVPLLGIITMLNKINFLDKEKNLMLFYDGARLPFLAPLIILSFNMFITEKGRL